MLILAGNHAQAKRYTQTARYISSIEDIRGFKDTTLLLVGTWHDRDMNWEELELYCRNHNIVIRDTNTLTDTERRIIDDEYEKHKYDNIYPHTTNPLQLKSYCKRCVKVESLSIYIYQMPQGDWVASANGIISDGFKSRKDAEEWAFEQF